MELCKLRANTEFIHRVRVRIRRAALGVIVCLAAASAHAQKPTINGGASTSKVMASRVADQKAVDSFFMEVVAANTSAGNAVDAAPTGDNAAWYLPNEWCVARLGYPKGKQLEGCTVFEVSGRTAAIVHTVLYCEAEHCEADFYLMSGTGGPRRLVGDVYGPWVLSPDRKSLFLGHTGMGVDDRGSFTGTYEAFLTRIDVATLKKSHVTACASPVLSPRKRWVVCRDAQGHVHRMPANGGKLEPVYRLNLGKDTINIDAHLGVSLHPVRFPDAAHMIIETLTREQAMKTKTINWKE
jgi:hypothetical protein